MLRIKKGGGPSKGATIKELEIKLAKALGKEPRKHSDNERISRSQKTVTEKKLQARQQALMDVINNGNIKDPHATLDKALGMEGRKVDQHHRSPRGVPFRVNAIGAKIDRFSPPPDTRGESSLMAEKTLGQVELLLLKGITKPSNIAATLGITHPHTTSMIERIHYRWAHTGGAGINMSRVRGESISRLNLISSQLWKTMANTKSDAIKISAISHLLQVHDRKNILDGVTQFSILQSIQSAIEKEKSGDQSVPVKDAIEAHKELLSLAEKLKEVANSKREAIQGEVIIDTTPEEQRP